MSDNNVKTIKNEDGTINVEVYDSVMYFHVDPEKHSDEEYKALAEEMFETLDDEYEDDEEKPWSWISSYESDGKLIVFMKPCVLHEDAECFIDETFRSGSIIDFLGRVKPQKQMYDRYWEIQKEEESEAAADESYRHMVEVESRNW